MTDVKPLTREEKTLRNRKNKWSSRPPMTLVKFAPRPGNRKLRKEAEAKAKGSVVEVKTRAQMLEDIKRGNRATRRLLDGKTKTK